MHPQGCPDRAELEGFVLGKLSARTFTRVTDHVENCVACKMSLVSLDQAADPLLSELRRFTPQDGSESEPVLQELIASVSSARAGRNAAGLVYCRGRWPPDWQVRAS